MAGYRLDFGEMRGIEKMKLLYIWNDSLYGKNEQKGYLLNSKYNIQFKEPEKRLYIEYNESYVEGFWGENIFDVMAVVGENGSGKTKLAYSIMNILNQMVTDNSEAGGEHFFIVFEEEGAIKTYVTDKFADIKMEAGKGIDSCPPSKDFHKIELFKFGYFTNALAYSDCIQEKYGVVFDGSLGGSFQKYFKDNLEMHYISLTTNIFRNYYDEEFDKVLDFLLSDLRVVKDLRDDDFPFVLPEVVNVSIKDYETNLKYILDELKEMGKKREDITGYCSNERNCLKEICKDFVNKDTNWWNGHLAAHLLLNLFKELCVPQTRDQKLEEKALKFLQIIEQTGKSSGSASLDTMKNIFDMLEAEETVYKEFDRDSIKHYRDIVNWMLETGIFQNLNSSNRKQFILQEDKEIIKKFRSLYKETRFPFPYLSFDFGLSTGEFNFLVLFSKIASMIQDDRGGNPCVMNHMGYEKRCTNVFLYLDEADLSLHPRWQQGYVSWILKFVTSYFKNCSVQILIATHSPIMLSDFPGNNVLYLWKECSQNETCCHAEKRTVRTFGSNIHTLFMDSFFLEDGGTMGAFAEQKINEIALEIKQKGKMDADKKWKIINYIGDDIIRNKLLQLYDQNNLRERKPQTEMDNAAIDATIVLLKNQMENLENTIKELEKIKGDKN